MRINFDNAFAIIAEKSEPYECNLFVPEKPVAPPISYSTATVAELLAHHNRLADERGVPVLATWTGERSHLAQRVAILNATKPKPSAPAAKRARKRREDPIRRESIKLLCVVDHQDKHGRTVGLTYAEILRRLRRDVPNVRSTFTTLRKIVAVMRVGEVGFEGVLPQIRPRSHEEPIGCRAAPQAELQLAA